MKDFWFRPVEFEVLIVWKDCVKFLAAIFDNLLKLTGQNRSCPLIGASFACLDRRGDREV